MSGLNNTQPHYVFRHELRPPGFDRLAEHGLDPKVPGDNLFVLDLAILGGYGTSEQSVLEVSSLERSNLKLTDLAFHGFVSVTVADELVRLSCAGYIARSGSGVMWIEDGVTPLDDSST